MSSDTFFALCYKVKLTNADLEMMTIGNCLDYIETFLELNNPKKETVRKATQKDFNAF
ncbi:hypothetical protein [Bacillus sp. NPDC094106]|uniref:hypothetical protein n=1 Tax=Bacillus sp. NPDC094106 TaxID=3363949 RepID=UPI0037F81ADB